jgi:hypothetical protein
MIFHKFLPTLCQHSCRWFSQMSLNDAKKGKETVKKGKENVNEQGKENVNEQGKENVNEKGKEKVDAVDVALSWIVRRAPHETAALYAALDKIQDQLSPEDYQKRHLEIARTEFSVVPAPQSHALQGNARPDGPGNAGPGNAGPEPRESNGGSNK